MAGQDKGIDRLREIKEKARLGGGEKRLEAQRSKGKLTARDRIQQLFDPESFVEIDPLVTHHVSDFGLDKLKFHGDGVVTGYGTVNGRVVYVFSQDFTVLGGSLGKWTSQKICRAMDLALQNGAPIVGILDSGGARIQEGVLSLGGYGEIFRRNTHLSGVIPQISAIVGPCAGGAVYSPAITDFVLMAENTSFMHITGPAVIKAATGEEVTSQELGGAHVHNTVSGNADFSCPNEERLFETVRDLVSFLPGNNAEDPPILETSDPLDRECSELDQLVPEDQAIPYDMRTAIKSVADDNLFLEVKEGFARNAIVGFIRLAGHPIGIIANQPIEMSGCLTYDASDKIARFVRFCDAFSIPILTFMDVPGFLPGVQQEYGGVIRHGAKILYAYAEASVPMVTVITRKAYGGSYVVQGSVHMGADCVLAWPNAELAVMGAEGAANIIFRREIASAEDPEKARKEKIIEYREKFANPFVAASHGYIDDVIEPRYTRIRCIQTFSMLQNKRVSRPPKKHGNIPL